MYLLWSNSSSAARTRRLLLSPGPSMISPYGRKPMSQGAAVQFSPHRFPKNSRAAPIKPGWRYLYPGHGPAPSHLNQSKGFKFSGVIFAPLLHSTVPAAKGRKGSIFPAPSPVLSVEKVEHYSCASRSETFIPRCLHKNHLDKELNEINGTGKHAPPIELKSGEMNHPRNTHRL